MNILDLAASLHQNIPEADYHARCEGLASKSLLDKIRRSPAHLRAYLDGAPEEPVEAFVLGTAFHAALLEPARFDRDYMMLPSFGDCRRKEPKANRDAWRKDHGWDEEREAIPGVTLLTATDYATVRGMVASVHAHPLASMIVTGGTSELTLRWRDEATGIECKGRVDHYVERLGLAIDVKSTEDGRARAFQRSVANYRYHCQQAMYVDAFAALGVPLRDFVFLVAEKTPPYAVALFSLDADAVARGRQAIREDLALFAECLESGEWPGYSASIQRLDLPGWSL